MKKQTAVELDGRSFTFAAAERALSGETFAVRLAPAARRAVAAARAQVERALASGAALYGINTGFGKLSKVRIGAGDLSTLQRNLLLSHATGVGAPLDSGVARLVLLLRANALARGRSGVRPELIRLLLDLFEAGVAPILPEQGSVGASGDLAPLAHLALLLIGRGEAVHHGRRRSGARILKEIGRQPLRLEPKEGLALINGTQVSTALAVAALCRARRLATLADVALALTLEALRGSLKAFDRRIHELRPHPGQAAVAGNVRRLLKGSRIVPSHAGCDRVQDPYSLRCAPQVHGASRDAMEHVAAVLLREMNSVTDNPLLFPDDDEVLNGGNFHAQPVALAADHLAAAVAELGSIAERRIENLVNPDLSGLPAFLAREPGLNSGLMICQVLAAALVSENKTLCHPAAVDSIPTSAGKEDHVSMATWAGRKALLVVQNVERVLAVEFLAAAQALDLATPWLESGRGAAAAYRCLRRRVTTMRADRQPAPDIARILELMQDGSLAAAARAAAGPLA